MGWVAIAGGFLLLGGGGLDLGPIESRLGMASSEGFGPLGQVFGGWDPALWPGRVIASQVWAWGEGGRGTSASVRWPEAIAAVAISLFVTHRLFERLGVRGGLLGAICFCASLGLIHKSSAFGIDLIAGLAVVAALDQALTRGPDFRAGTWAALAFLAGGWPPVAMVLLPMIVLGTGVSWRLFVPIVASVAGWSLWAGRVIGAEGVAAAFMLPMTKPPVWALVPRVLVLALPWGPLALLGLAPSVRAAWPTDARAWLKRQAQLGAAAVLAGTLVPGLAPTALVVALVAIASLAAAAIEAIWRGPVGSGAWRAFLAITIVTLLGWSCLFLAFGGYLAAAVSYYRAVAFALIVLALVLSGAALMLPTLGKPRGAVAALIALAIGIKIGHWGIYVQEWNYRLSQGPWGRAIGQWVPPNQPIYVFHRWPDDLMFHTQRPARQLPAPENLNFQERKRAVFVLLQEPEFEHWPDHAPPIRLIRRFVDERAQTRVLAATMEPIAYGRRQFDRER